MPTPLIHEPESAPTADPRTRTFRGRVRPLDPTLNAYLLALTRFDSWGPDLAPGYERETHFAPCGDWCRYEIIDRRTK